MEENEANKLIAKYNAGECTAEEKARLESWYLLHEHSGLEDLSEEDRLGRMDAIRNRLLNDIQAREAKPIRPLWRWTGAAAAVVLIGSVCYYFLIRPETTNTQLAQNQSHDIAPAVNKAILKTGHGKAFVLSAQQNGSLTGNIRKESDELLSYSSGNTNAPVVYDTLTNPKGGRPITVRLADGTKVWLNAATTFIYPERFAGNKREVELPDGEMIFEVTHNAKQPFTVKAGKQLIEDLGTTFNISNYQDDDAAQTTLVEGSIRLTSPTKTLKLQPGQAALVSDTRTDLLPDVDIDGVIAWQKGYFYFERADLKQVMAQFARWYDMQVVYEGPMPKKYFRGKLYRNVNASQALKILSFFNVKYRIEGKKVIIKS